MSSKKLSQLTTTFLWFVRGSVDVLGLIDLEMPSAAATLELLLTNMAHSLVLQSDSVPTPCIFSLVHVNRL